MRAILPAMLAAALSVAASPVPGGAGGSAFNPSFERVDRLPVPPVELDPDGASGIPVLCYHHISPDPLAMYSVTPTGLRHHLRVLMDAGFYLIDPEDMLNGLREVPGDRRPVMLTFDDGWQDNFDLLTGPDGTLSISADCAVGILESFCSANPGFGRGAVFFVSWDKVPFGQEAFVGEKLNMLLDMGYTIGNHTLRHAAYGALPAESWRSATVRPLENLFERVGLRSSSVYTMAYPGGFFPETAWARESMESYEFRGRSAVRLGFLVDGAVASMREICGTRWGRFYISRIDMSSYSISRVVRSSAVMPAEGSRTGIHDPLRFLPPSLESGPPQF